MNSSLRILITGGAGFLGSHLCERLLNDGHEVLCLDNFFTGSRRNIAALLDNKNFELVRHDVTESMKIECDQIYNLACPASPIHYQADPVQTTKTCVLGALHTLELANRIKARVFQASTSEVYGDPIEHPQKEDYRGNVSVTGPRACYDEGKRCAEALFFDFWRQYDLEIKVARIFNTYGPRMRSDDGRVISNFVVQALSGQPITIYGDGSQTRAFCYVDDMIDGFVRLMNAPKDVTGPVNLGTPRETSLNDLAKMILAMTGSKSEIVFHPLPQDDPKQRCPDIALAKSALGWQPSTALETGLEKTISYFAQQLRHG